MCLPIETCCMAMIIFCFCRRGISRLDANTGLADWTMFLLYTSFFFLPTRSFKTTKSKDDYDACLRRVLSLIPSLCSDNGCAPFFFEDLGYIVQGIPALFDKKNLPALLVSCKGSSSPNNGHYYDHRTREQLEFSLNFRFSGFSLGVTDTSIYSGATR